MTHTQDELLDQMQRAMWVGFTMGVRSAREVAEACVRVAETRMEDAIIAGVRSGCQKLDDDMAREMLAEEDDGGLADQVSQ